MYRAITNPLAFNIENYLPFLEKMFVSDLTGIKFVQQISHFSSGSGLNKKAESGCDEFRKRKTRKRASKGRIFILDIEHSFITIIIQVLERPQTKVLLAVRFLHILSIGRT
jgi:hypothetical protein